eukprot:jgi/Botrbrau1/7551/Bobra.0159s0003.3
MVSWKPALSAAGSKLVGFCCVVMLPPRQAVAVRKKSRAGNDLGWTDLPPDIQKKILGYLGIEDFRAAALVCKEWHCEYRRRVACAGASLVRSQHIISMIPKVSLNAVVLCWDDMCWHLARHENATFRCGVDYKGQRWLKGDAPVPNWPLDFVYFRVRGHSYESGHLSSQSLKARWCLNVHLYYRTVNGSGNAWIQTQIDVRRGRRGRWSCRHLAYIGQGEPTS